MNIFAKNNKPGLSLRKSLTISTIGHFIAAFLVLLVFGINVTFFKKPEHKIQDIHLVLAKPAKLKHRPKPKKAKTVQNKGGSKKASPKVVSKRTNTSIGSSPRKKIKSVKSYKSVKPVESIEAAEPDESSIPGGKIKPLSSDSNTGGESTTEVSNSGSGTGNGRIRDGGLDNTDVINNLLKSVDVTPYINDLKRRVKWNWKPPAGAGNKKVELFLRIAKNGELLILNVKKTSVNAEMDNAALRAVKSTLPLKQLPSGYNKGYLDVIITFDFNVH